MDADAYADADGDADADAVVTAIALPVLTYRRAKNDLLTALKETHAFHTCHNVKIISNNENGAIYQHTN